MTDILQWMYQYIQTFNISIFDIVDVAIIAVLLYRLLMLVRRSRAAQVAKAILLLLAALVISSSTMLNLRVIHFFLSHMVEMGMLALIVVFQPEIRRFLEQLGSTTLGDMFSREEAPPEVEEAISQTVQGGIFLRKPFGYRHRPRRPLRRLRQAAGIPLGGGGHLPDRPGLRLSLPGQGGGADGL